MKSDTSKNRPERELVKMLIENGVNDFKQADISRLMGISPNYFQNKIFRSSFSFRDIVSIATLKGYTLRFISETDMFDIDPQEFMNPVSVDEYINKNKDEINKLIETKTALENEIKRLKALA